MSGIVGEVIAGAEDIGEAVVGEVEHIAGAIFQPRPGGKIDTARRNSEAYSLADEPVAQQDTLARNRPVAVDLLAADLGVARTITLTANNPVLPLLPRDTTRRGAVVLAVDNPVYIAVDPNLANQAEGSASSTGALYLPVGVPVPIRNTSELWAAAVTTTGGAAVTAPSVPATTKYAQNTNAYPVSVTIAANGATISAVDVNGLVVGSAAGTYTVPAYGAISISYTVATPTWTWSQISSSSSRVSVIADMAGIR